MPVGFLKIRSQISILFGFFMLSILSVDPAIAQQRTNSTIKIPYKNKSYIGTPLAWDGREMMLLRRNGKINILPVTSSDDFVTLSDRFKPISTDVLRHQLQREFGSKYQVSSTGHFVVVHPPGDFQTWAMPFEKLYIRYNAYFSSRRIKLDSPEFPMVAVVLRTRNEFDKFLHAYHNYDPQILGYYSPKSNRIITYDQTAGKTRGSDWLFNANTIIHEATHQSAYNTGLHSRYGSTPRWISEGLAMMFEAPGVNNSLVYSKLSDRINRERLAGLQSVIRRDQFKGKIAELISRDDLFRHNPIEAYAISWGVTFYLSEKMPQQYQQFLRDDASRASFTEYSSRQRANAFAKAFGANLSDLESRIERFIVGLK